MIWISCAIDPPCRGRAANGRQDDRTGYQQRFYWPQKPSRGARAACDHFRRLGGGTMTDDGVGARGPIGLPWHSSRPLLRRRLMRPTGGPDSADLRKRPADARCRGRTRLRQHQPNQAQTTRRN